MLASVFAECVVVVVVLLVRRFTPVFRRLIKFYAMQLDVLLRAEEQQIKRGQSQTSI